MRRRPRTRRDLVAGVVIQVCVALVLRVLIARHVLAAPAISGAFFVEIGLVIWDVLSGIASVAGAILADIVVSLQAGFSYLSKFTVDSLIRVGGFFQDSFGIVTDLWTDVIKPALGATWDFIVSVHDFLEDWFTPIVNGLKKVYKAVTKIYNEWLAPIFKVIDISKRSLDVLSILGVDAAKAVEQKLDEFEAAIRQPFLDITTTLNEAIGWINNIIDLDGVFQRITLIKSLVTYKHDIVNAGINAISKPLTTDQQTAYAQQPQVVTSADTTAEMKSYFDGDDVPWKGAATEWAEDLGLMLRG